MWEQSTITRAGENLLAQWSEGSTLNIVKTTGGTGLMPAAELYNAEELSDERQVASIVGINRRENVITLQVQFETASERYNLSQIGVWAQINNGPVALLAIYQDTVGSAIPTTGQFVYNFWAAMAISHDGNLTVNVDTTSFITVENLYEILQDYIPFDQMGVPDGIATLDSDGLVPVSQLPPLDYIPTAEAGVTVATLVDGKVPDSQLPPHNYVPLAQKASAGGVATLDGNVKVPKAQLPDLSDLYLSVNRFGVNVATLEGGKIPIGQIPDLPYILTSKRSAADGVAALDANIKVPKAQLPDLSDLYILVTQKGAKNGVATLGSDKKVPLAQLPPLNYIPLAEKAVAGGVASLADDGKVPASQLRGGYVISSDAPTDTTLLWITPEGVMKFYYNNKWNNIVPTWA